MFKRPLILVAGVAMVCVLCTYWVRENYPEFFVGGPGYNFFGFLLTALGAIVGLLAYWVAIQQIEEAKIVAIKATDAAIASAEATTKVLVRLSSFAGLIDMQDVCACSASACSLLQSKQYAAGLERLLDLNRLIAKARRNESTHLAMPADEWDEIAMNVNAIHNVFAKNQLHGKGAPVGDQVAAVQSMAMLDLRLHNVKSLVQQRVGVDYGDA